MNPIRHRLLDMYRKARAHNPALARLIFRRMKLARARMLAEIIREVAEA